ncbi:zinc-dependent alcohol dehydrogenase [Methylobacterium phyllosphaerae]
MKALIYTGPNALIVDDVPVPVPGAGEALVRVEAVGICGSDMHAYHGHDARRPAPLILGHEAAGRVVEGPRAGARVAVNPLVTCGRCPACESGRTHLCPSRQILSMPPRPGAFADYVCVPEKSLVPIPDALSTTHAALAEPLAVAYHAVNQGRGFSAALWRGRGAWCWAAARSVSGPVWSWPCRVRARSSSSSRMPSGARKPRAASRRPAAVPPTMPRVRVPTAPT